jgi:hypothetical protein
MLSLCNKKKILTIAFDQNIVMLTINCFLRAIENLLQYYMITFSFAFDVVLMLHGENDYVTFDGNIQSDNLRKQKSVK